MKIAIGYLKGLNTPQIRFIHVAQGGAGPQVDLASYEELYFPIRFFHK